MQPFKGLIMKRLVLIASLLGFAVCMNPAIAKDTSEHLTAQQNKMSYCSKEAAAKDLHGDKRKEFMKECLSKKVDDGKKKLTQQQEKNMCVSFVVARYSRDKGMFVRQMSMTGSYMTLLHIENVRR